MNEIRTGLSWIRHYFFLFFFFFADIEDNTVYIDPRRFVLWCLMMICGWAIAVLFYTEVIL